MTYQDKLKDPRWQKLRLEIFQRDDFSCQSCGDSEQELHVHHKRYIKGIEPWEYPKSLLATLCVSCHSTETENLLSAIIEVNNTLRETFNSWELGKLQRAFSSLPTMNFQQRHFFLSALEIVFKEEKLIQKLTDLSDEIHNSNQSEGSN